MAFADLVAAADLAVRDHLGGVAVTYRPEHEDPVEVTGMFDELHVLNEPDRPGVEQSGPSVFLALKDLPVHPDDDSPTLTIGDTDYTVRERQYDGQGGVRLLLHEVT